MSPTPFTTPVMEGPSSAGGMAEGSRTPGSGVGTGTLATTNNGQMGTISLGTLIQFINQRTYSDLLNLAEILPRKSDMEKKIDIVKFAQRTRQFYVRLLALVKWAASASKVDKCCHIMNFLEKQNSLLTDTADKLFHMTKENLVAARLPHFHIPAAVQTLTTGTYDKLPLSIRQRILPSEPITNSDKKATLVRLEQIIRHRLVTASLPHQMKTTRVENGRVVLTVEQEFEAHLTVMSDNISDPWRLLSLTVLVEDRETGAGKDLVHPMQIWYIQQVVQSRLVDHPNPLHELYNILHAFALSLQLEVLHMQTMKLLEQRLSNRIRIEEYKQGNSLSLTYWRDLKHVSAPSTSAPSAAIQRLPQMGGTAPKQPELGYRLTVQINPTEPDRQLSLMHTPAMPPKDCVVSERAIRSELLSMERLLVHTIYLRSKARLNQLKQSLDTKLRLTSDKCVVSGSPSVLQVPLLQPCLRSEQLLITVNTHSGTFTVHIPQYPACSLMGDIRTALNADNMNKFFELISQLRHWLVCRRTEKSVQHLAATVHDKLPMRFESSAQVAALAPHKVFVTFHRHPNYVLIVEVKEASVGSACEVQQNLYLLLVKECSAEDGGVSQTTGLHPSLPKSYLKAVKLMPLDSFLCTHGPHTKVEVPTDSSGSMPPSAGGHSAKRKMGAGAQREPMEPAAKRIKAPAYFLPDVVQCVALCDQLCPLAHINTQLSEHGVKSGGVQVEDGGVGLMVKIVSTPPVSGVDPITTRALQSSLLSVSLRVQIPPFRGVKSVSTEYIFSNVPFTTEKEAHSPNRRSVVSTHEISSAGVYASNCVQAIVDEWTAIAKLYHLVYYFAEALANSSADSDGCSPHECLHEIIKIRSYTFKSISLSYGPHFSAYCNITYSTKEKGCLLAFGCDNSFSTPSSTSSSASTTTNPTCGSSPTNWAINPHSLMKTQLQEEIERAGKAGLIRLSLLLNMTYQPSLSLAKLQPTLHAGFLEKRTQAFPIEVFSVVAHSGTCLRIIYRNLYCLALQMLPNGLVSIRDGAFSSFDNSRIIDEFLPIQGLKAFLSKYVDESALARRRSQSEDDNPPTPVPMDDSSTWPVPHKPSSPARHGPITPPVSSNPHTPASPHPVAAGGFGSSPAGGFALASPPSIPGMNPSPAGGHMSHPSPGGAFPAASPSGSLHQHGVSSPSFLTVPSPVGGMGPLSSMTSPASTAFLQGGGSGPASRVLPNKTYAAAIPTLLTYNALNTLCSPPSVLNAEEGPACVLEQFLGSTYLRRHLNQASKNLNETPSTDGNGSLQLKTDSLLVCVSLVSSPINCLTLKLQPTAEYSDRWSNEEMQVLEKFFSLKVASAPYKPNAMTAFHQVLRFPYRILKDCVKIMQLELMNGCQAGAKWLVQWCLTVPPIGHQLVPPGAVGVIISKNKILFFLQLTRASSSTENDSTGGGVIVPVVHDINANKTQMARRTEQQPITDPSLRLSHAINELMARPILPPQESSVFPCVKELLMHLNVGPDGMPYPPTSQTPTQPPSLPANSQIGSPRMSSPHGMSSPHATATTPTSHYQPSMGQGSPIGMGQTMAQQNPMVQQNTMGQNVGMGQQAAMVQGQGMGQAGMVGPNMGMQGPRGMQPGMQGMSPMQGMQPGMPGQQTGMQGNFGTGMYR